MKEPARLPVMPTLILCVVGTVMWALFALLILVLIGAIT